MGLASSQFGSGSDAVDIRDLSYSYGKGVNAIDRLSLTVGGSSILALLGPNGSGKTTLFQLLLGLLTPADGSLTVLGSKPTDRLTKRFIGWVPDELPQTLLLTLDEYFALSASVQPDFDHAFAEGLLLPFGLAESRLKLMPELSHGMRKKAQLIAAISHHPRLLLLDEPFSGLDPESHYLLDFAIRRIQRLGTTIVFASHETALVESLATHVAILRDGELSDLDSPGELCERYGVTDLRGAYLAATGVISDTQLRSDQLVDLLEKHLSLSPE